MTWTPIGDPERVDPPLEIERRGELTGNHQMDVREPIVGHRPDRDVGPLHRRLESERPQNGRLQRDPSILAESQSGRTIRSLGQRDSHRQDPDGQIGLLLEQDLARPPAVDEDAALATHQATMRREGELEALPEGTPADDAGRRLTLPAVLLAEAALVGLVGIAPHRRTEQEVMQHDVVQHEDARSLEGESVDLDVVLVVAHVVDGRAALFAEMRARDRIPPLGDGRRDRLTGGADDAQVAERLEVLEEIRAVVGDAGSDRRQRRDVVEAETAHPAWSSEPARFRSA